MQFSFGLATHYARLWDSMVLPDSTIQAAKPFLKSLNLIFNMTRYKEVESATGVPWPVIAIIHQLEASGDYSTYLGNGDPLSAKTVHEPKGRGPFENWTEGAIDAMGLMTKRQNSVSVVFIPEADSSWLIVEGMLYFMEFFNGAGYLMQHPAVNSPYLWAGTNLYSSGKYSSDGQFDPNLVSKQIGGAALLKMIVNAGLSNPLRIDTTVMPSGEFEDSRLQILINSFYPTPQLLVDGRLGPVSRAKMREIFG